MKILVAKIIPTDPGTYTEFTRAYVAGGVG